MTDMGTADGKIFVSYSQTDVSIVHPICNELVARHLPIWIDQAEGRVGEDIVEMMNRGLSESKVFIAFAGANYFERGRFTSAEFGAAFHKAVGASGWRMLIVKLAPQVELPPMAASRLYIVYTTPAETAERIAKAIRNAEIWDGPVYHTTQQSPNAQALPVELGDIGDRDLEIVVTAFLDSRIGLLRDPAKVLKMEVILPRGRKLELTILRTIAENEGITLTLKTLLESISLNERFVHKFAQQLDEGLLGRFEAPTEVALERFQKKLQDARTELRRQISEIVEHARVVHGFTAG